MSIKDALNDAQWEAVAYNDGPSLVIAGAGSGKTRVLTYKIAYLIEQGMKPWNILSLTFTNKAAREMNERIAAVVGQEAARWVWSGTFHSIFAKILRQEAVFMGYNPDYTIYDSADSRSLIKAIIKERGLDDKVYKPQLIASRISEAKNALVLPEAYLGDESIRKRDRMDGIGDTGNVYSAYVARCRAAQAMDFDDLLLNTFLLFRDHPAVRQKYKDRFSYILVDEYQDTNAAQHRIISQLTEPDSRICVVGDDAQSIYAFRGAKIDNILGFQTQYPGARLIKLECNYRSTQTIVDAANSLIRHNKGQISKKIYSNGEKGDRLKVMSACSDKEEALKVAGEIRRLHRGPHGTGYNSMALLYRTNAQSRSFEEAFRSANIPYRIYGGQSFYQRKEIKDALAYFRLVTNPNDEEAFKRVINYPARGIGQTTVGKLQLAAAENGVSLWAVAYDPTAYGVGISKATATKIAAFLDLIEDFRLVLTTTNGYDLAADILRKSGMGADIMADTTPEGLSRKENIEELLGAIKANETEMREENGTETVPLTSYLSQVSLLTDADQQDDGEPKVTLMTVHAAKGLEFEAVFVTGMEDDLFPNSNARYYPKEMEEERRLFYVAITRAKTYCCLTHAKSRYRFGNMEFAEESPFLREIDARYLEKEDGGFRRATPTAEAEDWYGGRLPEPGFTKKTSYESRHTNTSPTGKNTLWQQTTGGNNPRTGTLSTRITAQKPPTPTGNFTSATALRTTNTTRTALPPLSVGDTVEHERFGTGTVLALEGSGDSAKATVDFQNAGRKNLLLKFAKIKRI